MSNRSVSTQEWAIRCISDIAAIKHILQSTQKEPLSRAEIRKKSNLSYNRIDAALKAMNNEVRKIKIGDTLFFRL